MTAAAYVGIFLLCSLLAVLFVAMASVDLKATVIAFAVTGVVVVVIVLAAAMIATGLWPWAPGFWAALT